MTRVDSWGRCGRMVVVGSILEEYLPGEVAVTQNTLQKSCRAPDFGRGSVGDLDHLRQPCIRRSSGGNGGAVPRSLLTSPGCITTIACTASPHVSSGTPNTAASANGPGCWYRGVFHFHRVHVLCARHDHVFGSVDHEQIVAIVEVAEITRVVPGRSRMAAAVASASAQYPMVTAFRSRQHLADFTRLAILAVGPHGSDGDAELPVARMNRRGSVPSVSSS